MGRHSKLIQQLKRHEGCSLELYVDSTGHATIGIGRNLEDVGLRSEAEAEYLLSSDMFATESKLIEKLGDTFENLSGPRQNVLTNMAFNLGVGGLLEFDQMIGAIKNNNFEIVSEEMLDSKWHDQVGQRAEELAEQMETNEFHTQ